MFASYLSSSGLMTHNKFMDMYNNISLILQGSHFVTHHTSPLVANTIEIGGIHCRQGNPLPLKLQTILDNSASGVVYISFGTAIKPSSIHDDKKGYFWMLSGKSIIQSYGNGMKTPFLIFHLMSNWPNGGHSKISLLIQT